MLGDRVVNFSRRKWQSRRKMGEAFEKCLRDRLAGVCMYFGGWTLLSNLSGPKGVLFGSWGISGKSWTRVCSEKFLAICFESVGIKTLSRGYQVACGEPELVCARL